MTEWHDHDGEAWPEHAHPEDVVEVRYRYGGRFTAQVVEIWRMDGWKHDLWPDVSDIMSYRVLSK